MKGTFYRLGRTGVMVTRGEHGEPAALIETWINAPGNAPLPKRLQHLPIRSRSQIRRAKEKAAARAGTEV